MSIDANLGEPRGGQANGINEVVIGPVNHFLSDSEIVEALGRIDRSHVYVNERPKGHGPTVKDIYFEHPVGSGETPTVVKAKPELRDGKIHLVLQVQNPNEPGVPYHWLEARTKYFERILNGTSLVDPQPKRERYERSDPSLNGLFGTHFSCEGNGRAMW